MRVTAAIEDFSPGSLSDNRVDKTYTVIKMDKVDWGIRLLNGFTFSEEASGMTLGTNQTTEPDDRGLEVLSSFEEGFYLIQRMTGVFNGFIFCHFPLQVLIDGARADKQHLFDWAVFNRGDKRFEAGNIFAGDIDDKGIGIEECRIDSVRFISIDNEAGKAFLTQLCLFFSTPRRQFDLIPQLYKMDR